MFDHILLPLDGSPLAECVLPHAVALAQAFGARITLLRVLVPPEDDDECGSSFIDPVVWSVRRQATEGYLVRVAERMQALDLNVAHVVLDGPPAQRVVEFAWDNDVNLIILSSHGRSGLSRWSVSSVAQKILDLASSSVLIVRAYSSQPTALADLRYRRIVVPVDGSSRAECALAAAGALAGQHESQLTLVHAIQRPTFPRRAPLSQDDIDLIELLVERSRDAAEEYLRDLIAVVPGDARNQLLVSEDGATSLHELVETEQTDLVVMSAHGRSGKNRWPFGSLTTSFIQYGGTSLLIVQDLARDALAPSKAALAAEQQKGY
jgi:nucleotide-binding universal stress UspA family protein